MSEPPVTGEWTATTELPTVPGYELFDELGRGGMGVVYRARHLGTGRYVALKLIRDGALAGPRELARFRTEAEATARIQHPNVVQIYEVGEHAGRPFFAMELVEGGSLDKHLDGKPLPSREAAELVRTLALALGHAHGLRIVHRDLKPANVLLAVASGQWPVASQTDEQLKATVADLQSSLATGHWSPATVPKITDFGLAKLLDREGTAWTQDGAVVGTPSYMAPEQAAGRVSDICPATDVYALGATLYELLTGKPPFDADSWDRTVQQVIHHDPAPPTRTQPDVPHDLETICLKCLEKEPGRRYATGAELADDLGRFLDGSPVTAAPLSSAERLARHAARDGYRILGEIGHGPLSVVYHARTESLNQPVALKVFAAGLCSRDEWEARLKGFADRWAVLAHPQIVPVHGAGWWDGQPYFVTEYAAHGTLAGQLTARPQHFRDALRLVMQLTEVVGYAHRQGVIHGNLKPSNILFAAEGIPRVADFQLTGGLFQGGSSEDAAGLGYLPPELLTDRAAEPRPHTDVYGLGVILYELLTGRQPFTGATAAEVTEQVLTRDPVPPSQLNPEVESYLNGVCLKCLRKNPWWRFPRPFDLFTRLRDILGDPKGRGTPGRLPDRGDVG